MKALSPQSANRQSAHSMPYGAERMGDGRTRFRLWAPSADRVDVVLGEPARLLPMKSVENGFFEAEEAHLQPGTLYQYRINQSQFVPDPASRFQPEDVHGRSMLIDPTDFAWTDQDWQGRPWEEAVIYELHVGTFTPKGTFLGVIDKLDYLVHLGVTAIELMPVSDFPGRWNWGYDGVLPFAPDSRYGTPHELKQLIQSAHAKGLMVFLDVVYNHFGPEGNYLYTYAQPFFTQAHHTPWGDAFNFEGPYAQPVRDFFIHNALYWCEEFHVDGLRLDAAQAMIDSSTPHILEALAEAVSQGPGRTRDIHLILENEGNEARYLRAKDKGLPHGYSGQWNDDIHHSFQVLVRGNIQGYFRDYAENPADHLGRCLTCGFDYQGEPSGFREGRSRGESTEGISLHRFIAFIQNHDQVANSPMGQRLTYFSTPSKVQAAVAVYLLSPATPMLFMGEEWAARQPFPFFCDLHEELSQAITEGRRSAFATFEEFALAENHHFIPNPCDEKTYESAILNWADLESHEHRQWFHLYQHLLTLRRQEILPLFRQSDRMLSAEYTVLSPKALVVQWHFLNVISLTLLANFEDVPVVCPAMLANPVVYQTNETVSHQVAAGTLPANTVLWFKQREELLW